MGKVKIKRKSTLIDMTAMSDVTVLLLTFFMLTSTFLTPEPVKVITPSSVSEVKVPMTNLITILVAPQTEDTETVLGEDNGRVYISFTGDADSTFSSEKIRVRIMQEAVNLYNEQQAALGRPAVAMPNPDKFMKISMFGTPFQYLAQVVEMEPTKRDEVMGVIVDPKTKQFNPMAGIPVDFKGSGQMNWANDNNIKNLNEFQIWLKAISNVAKAVNQEQIEGLSEEEIRDLENLHTAIKRKGEGIAVKADKDTPWTAVHLVFDNLQTMDLNKFSLMTSLKSENE